MANAIELFKQYIAMLDEIYKLEAKTNVLDGANELVRQGANANELVIPMISMDGLADYSRASGYVNGSVDFNFETVKCNFDRGRMFSVDAMDDIETMGMVFGKLSSEFVRTKVIPELDAFRMAKYASLSDISTVEAADLSTGADVVKALRAATTKMNNDEVPEANRVLFIETGLKGLVDDLDTTKSKEVLKKFSQIVEMPQNRFYTGIKQLSGGSSEEKGGYTRATGANNINFMVVEKSAAIQFAKRVNSKIISPEQNQDADAYKYGYRQVAIADAYKNKRAGIYLHKSTVTA
nr:MAG TPA: Major capsid protein [Caudoviricetes sp.]